MSSAFIKFSQLLGLDVEDLVGKTNIDTISDLVGADKNPLEMASDASSKRYDVSSGGKLKSGAKRFQLTYPEDLFDHVGAFIFFNIRSSNIKSTIPSFGEIRLFMPATLRVSYGAQWSEIELPLEKINALGGDVVNKIVNAYQSSGGVGDAVLKEISALADAATAIDYKQTGYWGLDNYLKKNMPGLSGELRRNGFIPPVGDNQATTNPFAAINYNAPSYRQLQLEFDFLARNPDEAEEIRKILKAFKLAMHPAKTERGDSAVFWDAPYIFEIYFFTPSATNMFNFKKSALIGMSVDYGASGIQTFFKDGQPVHIKTSLEFKELGYLTREDIEYNY